MAAGAISAPDAESAPDDSTGAVIVAIVAGLGVAVAKVGAAVVTGSTAMAAESAHSLADTANDLFLLAGQRRSRRPPTTSVPSATVGRPTSGR